MPSAQEHHSVGAPDVTTRRQGRIRSFFSRCKESFRQAIMAFVSMNYQYESRHRLFGLPLLCINLGLDKPDGRMRHARGIVAIGIKAVGLLCTGKTVNTLFP